MSYVCNIHNCANFIEVRDVLFCYLPFHCVKFCRMLLFIREQLSLKQNEVMGIPWEIFNGGLALLLVPKIW